MRLAPFMFVAAMPATLAAAASPPSRAEPATTPSVAAGDAHFVQALEAFVADARRRLEVVPGIAVAISRANGPLLVAAYGRADVETGLPATPDTLFYIASSTKSFVGLALARLDARGEIDLDWTLAELAPDVGFAPEVRAGEVTLRHLLTHTHGLDNGAMTFRLAYSGEHDPAALWRLLARLEPNGEAPLGTFNYGNLGYNVATLLIERRLGRSWQEIVETEVLEPLGLRRTIARGLAGARRDWAFASPYDSARPEAGERLYLVKEDDTMQSAGGMFSTARDLARWIQVNLAAARGEASPIPAPVVASTHNAIAALDERFEMFQRSGYGLGWYSGDFGGDGLFHSFGGFAGARAHVSFMPARNLGVAVLVNDQGSGFVLADAVAAFAYEWFQHGPESASREGVARIERIAARSAELRQRDAGQRAERAQRRWQLTLPRARYAGRYCSPDYGTISLEGVDGQFAMTMGRLRAVAEPFTDPDSMRFEPIPGSGMVLRFRIDDQTAVAVTGFGSTFERCG